MNEKRNSGKTFRRILKALYTASEGKDVVFFCRNQMMADHTLRRAYEACKVLGVFPRVQEHQYYIHMPNGNRVRFVTTFERDASRGIDCIEIRDDLD